ncbi:MAG TPA: response regulator [Holophagaceae bacterium]|jgi:CheY-like chemotaxis protein/anti-sigma regulatory factor (Ser/Thr protein kinase)|nr:response regulator [Holophagaceae bacterium]
MADGTLLIVDDDPLQREYLATLLGQGGYAALHAGNGEEGLKRLKEDPETVDGVLLDWRMPGMDGLTMLRRIKADPRISSIPVIFQTGLNDEALLAECLAAGAHYYLTKPVREDVLLATAYSAVQSRRRHRELWFQVREAARTLALMDLGRFRFRTQEDAENLTHLLAAACPDPDRAAIGLSELLLNAVEHGNLEITYQETSEAIERRSRAELIRNRIKDPRYSSRFAEVRFEHLPDRYRFLVKDQGNGFDWKKFLQLSPERAYDTHGRGVYMASNCFDRMEFMGNGNTVTVEILLPEGWPHT